jgi:hypothetical protein
MSMTSKQTSQLVRATLTHESIGPEPREFT